MEFRELTDKMMHLYRQGNYAEALNIVEGNAADFPDRTARTTFWRMCLLSLCNRPEDAISVFQNGLDSGNWWAESQFSDTDLDLVRELPKFKRLMEISQQRYEEEREHVEQNHRVLLPEPYAQDEYPLLIAVHGRNGNKDSHIEHWDVARRRGWLVLSVQSTQPLSTDSFCWDDSEKGLSDLIDYVERIFQEYSIDHRRSVIAGFSQGSGLAILAVLTGKISVGGFIGVATSIAEPESLADVVGQTEARGYFISGGRDYTLEKARAVQKLMSEHNLAFTEEHHPDLGHEFPSDFEQSFDKAIDFIFKEQE